MKVVSTKNGNERKDTRSQFSPYLNQKVHCRGEFAGININNGVKAITILFHNVILNDEVSCDHVWVFYNKNFNHLNIQLGCIMEFDAIVQKYKHEERLGIGDCSNISIVSNGIEKSNDELSLKINTIKYDNFYLQKNPGGKMPAHIAFLKEFGIKSGTRVMLKYDDKRNHKNSSKVFLELYVDGEKVDKEKPIYFDSENKHGIIIGKYFIPIKEQSCRLLSLFYLRTLVAA